MHHRCHRGYRYLYRYRYRSRYRRRRLDRLWTVNQAARLFSGRFLKLLVLRGGCVRAHVRLHQSEPHCAELNQGGECGLCGLCGGCGGWCQDKTWR